MNKLYFEAQVLNLHAEDYQYMQNAIEQSLISVVKSIFSRNSNIGGIICGFTLQVDPSDPTKLCITHEDGIGALLNANGKFLATSTGFTGIGLSNASIGVVNYVYAQCTSVLGSYNHVTHADVEGVQLGIDYSNYHQVYNRQIDKLAIYVYTLAEYSALPLAEKNNLILLGSTIAQGSSQPLVTVDTAGATVIYVTMADKSILFRHLSDAFAIPQSMIWATSTGKVNDTYFGSSVDLKDDLNRLRSEIRTLKGTTAWSDPTPGNLLNFDKALNKMHSDGVVTGYGQQFDTEIITSTGATYACVHPGKMLHLGNVYLVPIGVVQTLPLNPMPIFNVGNWADKTDYEEHYVGAAPQTIILSKKSDGYVISDEDLYITSTSNTRYDSGIDYTFNSNTGEISTIFGGDINNEVMQVYYKYSGNRLDAIDMTSTGSVVVTDGVISSNPAPPIVTSGNFRLFYVARQPFIPTVTADLTDCRTYLQQVRDCTELSPIEYTNTPYAGNKCTYYTSTGVVDSGFNQWTVTSTGVAHATTSSLGAYVVLQVLSREHDTLWIRASKSATSPSLNIAFESVSGSNVFDTNYTINLTADNTTADDCLVFVAQGISEGYHKCKITCNSAGTFNYYGLLCGQLDVFYTKDYIEASKMRTTDIDITGNVNSKIIVKDTTESTSSTNGALVVTGGAGIAKQLRVAGNTTLSGDLAVNGGDLTSSSTTMNIVNSTTTTINLGGAATAVNIGAATGTTAVKNNATVAGTLNVTGTLGVTGVATVTNTTDATSKDTGCMVLEGGLGVEKAIVSGTTITAQSIISTVITGTAPLTVASTTKVANLNADMVDNAQVSIDGTLASNSDALIPTERAIVTYTKDIVTYTKDGWIPSNETWSYSSADSPTFLATIAGDKTSKYSKGMKLKLKQQQALTKYWSFDTNNSEAINATVMTNIGTPTYTAGKFGKALTLNGIDQALKCADNTFKPAGAFTIKCQIKVTNGGECIFMSSSLVSNKLYGFGIYTTIPDGSLLVYSYAGVDSNNAEILGKFSVCDGAYHEIVLTFRDNWAQIYVDGNLDFSGYLSAPGFSETSYVRIGCHTDDGVTNTGFLNGQIDDLVLIDGYALDEETIHAKYIANTAQGVSDITIAKKFIITDVSYSTPNTTLTMYGGTDFALTSGVISNPYYSMVQQPFGFNRNPDKWSVLLSDSVQRIQNTPVANTRYQLCPLTLSAPIGEWCVQFQITIQVIKSGAVGSIPVSMYALVSSSPSGTTTFDHLVGGGLGYVVYRSTLFVSDTQSFKAKTTLYMFGFTDTGSVASIEFNWVSGLSLRLTNLYL